MKTTAIAQRFWEKVDKSPGHGQRGDCWVWTAYRDRDGYGNFHIEAHPEKAHRVSYRISKGDIPAGIFVLHSCDNPPCVNPEHLSLGTVQDNSDQMVARGRAPTGDQHWAHVHPEKVRHGSRINTTKLTVGQVQEIRQRCAFGTTYAALGREYGVYPSTIRRVANRKCWKHVG